MCDGPVTLKLDAVRAGASDYLTKPIELSKLLEGVRDALAAREEAPPPPAPAEPERTARRARVREAVAPGDAAPALADALRAHHEALIEHLALEEELVIPALLALEPAEFEDYYHSDIRGLLQRLDERDQRAGTSPLPVRPK